MRLKITKILLIFWTLFIGLGAFFGGVSMLIAPDGSILQMEAMLPYFQVLPFADILFQDYIFSGIMLIIVNGISNVVSAILIIRNKKIGYVLGTLFGFTLMLWIIIQFIIFPTNVLSTVYFIFGVLQLITGYIALVSYNQMHFIFDIDEYKNINSNSKSLVVFFSRMGYTKKIAYEKADSLGANIFEIKTKDKISGTLGFWWCGRFGMHRWGMELQPYEIDFSKYERIVLVSPVWVFGLSAPMREFINKNIDYLSKKEIDLVVNGFTYSCAKSAAKEAKKLLEIKNIDKRVTKLGHTFKKIK